MPHAYSTCPLKQDQIDLAYLLVDASGCGVKRSDWNAFCAVAIDSRRRGGEHDDVIVALDVDGHVKGLFVTEMSQSPLFGRVLGVPMFLTASAGDEDGIIIDLLEAVKRKAREHSCADIRVWTKGSEGWMRVMDALPVASRYAGMLVNLV